MCRYAFKYSCASTGHLCSAQAAGLKSTIRNVQLTAGFSPAGTLAARAYGLPSTDFWFKAFGGAKGRNKNPGISVAAVTPVFSYFSGQPVFPQALPSWQRLLDLECGEFYCLRDEDASSVVWEGRGLWRPSVATEPSGQTEDLGEIYALDD